MKKMVIVVMNIAMVMAMETLAATASDLAPVLQQAKAEVSAALTAIDKDLADAAKKLAAIDRKGDEARKILSAIRKDRAYVYDCSIVDTNGKLILIEAEKSRKHEGADISFEAPVQELFKTKSPLVSNVSKMLDGSNKIDFEYPIITVKGELVGAVSLLVSHDKLLECLIAPLVKDKPCKIWVMQTDGLCIYDQDPAQVNKNIFTDPVFQPFTDLISFARTVAKEPNGAGSYEFYKKDLEDKTVVKKDAVWDTVKMPANEWRIVTVEIKENQQAPKKTVQ